MRNHPDLWLYLAQTYKAVANSTSAIQRTDQLIQALDQVLVGLPSLSSERSPFAESRASAQLTSPQTRHPERSA